VTAWLPLGAEEWAGRPLARTAASSGLRQRVNLTGKVRSVAVRRAALSNDFHRQLDSASASTNLEAELDDGTGLLLLRWVGRDRIFGIIEGVVLTVEGVVLEERGSRVVLNPLYRFA